MKRLITLIVLAFTTCMLMAQTPKDVVDFEGDNFRGQKAPTGSFSAKTLPVGPECHAFGT